MTSERDPSDDNSQVEFSVAGLPPTKNEALSLFNPTHGQHAAVIRLLEAARAATDSSSFRPYTKIVGMGVLIETATGRAPADATNYLGGIGDVLQSRGKKALSRQYGQLAEVALFEDDSLIRELRYGERAGPVTQYFVRVWRILPSDLPSEIK